MGAASLGEHALVVVLRVMVIVSSSEHAVVSLGELTAAVLASCHGRAHDDSERMTTSECMATACGSHCSTSHIGRRGQAPPLRLARRLPWESTAALLYPIVTHALQSSAITYAVPLLSLAHTLALFFSFSLFSWLRTPLALG